MLDWLFPKDKWLRIRQKAFLVTRKKWNLDGTDGYTHCWRDLRKDQFIFGERDYGGGNTMCWAAFCADGLVDLRLFQAARTVKIMWMF